MTKKPATRTRHDRRAERAPHPAIASVTFTPAAAEPTDAAPAPTGPSAEEFRPTLHGQIRPDPLNPRKVFDEDGLAELAASIVRDRLLEPLVIRAVEGEAETFMLIAGERRWRAIGRAIEAGEWAADRPIPCMLREVSESDARRLALVENLQRRDLNAVEEARALQQLAELTGSSAAQIGRDLGFTERWAQQRLSLLKLSDGLQRQVELGKIKVEHARELVGLMPRLPAIKVAELECGATDVPQLKAWLAEQPAPLGDAATLAMLELLEKMQASPYKPNAYTSQEGVEILARTEREDRGGNGVRIRVKVGDPAFDELVKRGLLELPREQQIEGVEIGRHFVQRQYYSDGPLKVAIPEALNAKARKARIVELRVKLHGLQREHDLEATGGYATAWLNTPPAASEADLPFEVRQQIGAERDRRASQSETYRAEEKARAAERAQATAAQKAALEAIAVAAAAAIGAADRGAAIVELAAAFGHPLPWFHIETSDVVDAAGGLVVPSGYHYETDQHRQARRLMVHLVNAAGGLATPDRKPSAQDPDAPAREAFTFQVAGALIEDAEDALDDGAALRQAEAGLDAFLRQQAIDYGDAEYDWGPDGIQQLAQLIRLEDLGQQVDLEEAVAAAQATQDGDGEGSATDAAEDMPEAAQEGEFSPQLLALAGARRS